MSDAKTIRLIGDTQRQFAHRCITDAPKNYVVTIREETRTAAQNKKLWPMLMDVSKQVDWYGRKLTKEEWKDVLTASLRRAKVVPGIDGGFVTIGLSTSQMGVREFADLVELIYAFGAEHNVEWTEPVEVPTLEPPHCWECRSPHFGHRDPAYLAELRKLPCVICESFGTAQTSPTEAHHTFCGRYSGRKTPDRQAIPLCLDHHQGLRFDRDKTKLAIHQGKASWVEAYGLDTDWIAVTQDKIFGENK